MIVKFGHFCIVLFERQTCAFSIKANFVNLFIFCENIYNVDTIF